MNDLGRNFQVDLGVFLNKKIIVIGFFTKLVIRNLINQITNKQWKNYMN